MGLFGTTKQKHRYKPCGRGKRSGYDNGWNESKPTKPINKMPLYSYTADDGQTIEVQGNMLDRRPETIRRSGKAFHRNPAADHRGHHDTNGAGWPLTSSAVGVHPDQIQEAMASDKRDGVPVRYNRDGDVVFQDKAQRDRWMKAKGYFDRNGCTSPRNL